MVDGGRRRIQAKGSSCSTRKDSVQSRVEGTKLHEILSHGINHLETEVAAAAKKTLTPKNKATEEEKQWFNRVHDFLKKKFKVSLLPSISEVRLCGYAAAVENLMPNCYFWEGHADAIGLLEGEDEYKYVIVDWKTQSQPNFWEFSTYPTLPYRQYLHQCLVYARLLKMHLSLDYLPPILLVPFNSEGEYMHPRLFTDYPDESKQAIEKYQWSTNPPSLKFKKGPLFKDTLEEGLLQGNMKLTEVFKEGATLADFCEALKFCRISVED
ncbi:uncharacterized protein LOC114966678 [Acropora millepora]|uniref:uncharacterized protein LOC114966678 n=1 Tax=Acropora millepora TaxID=45264 RepID=UPI001CF1AAAC|nr:uncharacterized protein LOC114966678 [Acropora millepora]